MKTTEIWFDGEGQLKIHGWKWLPDDGEPKAVVQVAHGMQEYSARYAELAQKLTYAGYAVYANDHRGHGKTLLGPGKLGHLGPGSWLSVLMDMNLLSSLIKEEQPDKPLFLLGHSWGSFLTQAYIQRWASRLAGAILAGTNGSNFLVKPGIPLAWAICKIRGADTTAGLLDLLSVGGYNKKFEPGATGREWLTRDVENVRAYVDDPLCGAPFPNSFFLQIVQLINDAWTPDHEKRIPRNLPIFMISGDDDPVGFFGKGVRDLYNRYRKYGMTDVTLRLYEGARHEVFHETNREEAFAETIAWLSRHV